MKIRIARKRASKAFKIAGNIQKILNENLEKFSSGYLRITTLMKGRISDYYIFFINRSIVGAYGEIEDEGFVYGKEAEKMCMTVENGVAVLYSVDKGEIGSIIKNYPFIRVEEKTKREIAKVSDGGSEYRKRILEKYGIREPDERQIERILKCYKEG